MQRYQAKLQDRRSCYAPERGNRTDLLPDSLYGAAPAARRATRWAPGRRGYQAAPTGNRFGLAWRRLLHEEEQVVAQRAFPVKPRPEPGDALEGARG